MLTKKKKQNKLVAFVTRQTIFSRLAFKHENK